MSQKKGEAIPDDLTPLSFLPERFRTGFPWSVCPFGGQPNAGTLQIAFSQAVIRDQDRHDLRLSDSGGLRLRRRRLVRALPLGYKWRNSNYTLARGINTRFKAPLKLFWNFFVNQAPAGCVPVCMNGISGSSRNFMFHSVSYSESLIGLDWIPAQARNDGIHR